MAEGHYHVEMERGKNSCPFSVFMVALAVQPEGGHKVDCQRLVWRCRGRIRPGACAIKFPRYKYV
jgi:hypothetical protein